MFTPLEIGNNWSITKLLLPFRGMFLNLLWMFGLRQYLNSEIPALLG